MGEIEEVSKIKASIAFEVQGRLTEILQVDGLRIERVQYTSGPKGFSIGGFDLLLPQNDQVSLERVQEQLQDFIFSFNDNSFEVTAIDVLRPSDQNNPADLLVTCRSKR